MTRNLRMFLGFSIVIVLILVQITMSHKFQLDIFESTSQIKNVESPLEVMSERARGYGIMLIEEVHGALLHAQRGEYTDVEEHKLAYDKVLEEQKNLFISARILLSQSKASNNTNMNIARQLDIIGEFNLKIISLERKGFEAIDSKDLELANVLLVGGDHKIYKSKLFEAYDDWSKLQNQLTLTTSENILNHSQKLIYLDLWISIGLLLAIIFTMYSIRSLVIEKSNFKKKRR